MLKTNEMETNDTVMLVTGKAMELILRVCCGFVKVNRCAKHQQERDSLCAAFWRRSEQWHVELSVFYAICVGGLCVSN